MTFFVSVLSIFKGRSILEMGSIRQGFRALLGILGADKEERDEFRGAYYFLSIIFFVLIGRDNYLR